MCHRVEIGLYITLMLLVTYVSVYASYMHCFSFILLPPWLKIPAPYEAQQVPPEWSPKFLPADLLLCVTLPHNSLCMSVWH